MNIIEIKNVSMMFKLQSERIETFKEYVVKYLKRQLKHDNFWALKDVTVDIKKNESLAIIGRNGAGKSTLLRLIAGVMGPTSGTVNVHGTVAPLLNLGAGFDYDLTAHENIFLNGAMLGFSRKEMKQKYDSIVEFSELKDFLNVPIKNFSSGMIARLGFAIATDVQADILIADEILSVGDISFRKKCERRIEDIRRQGATFILVAHGMEQVRKMCNKALWLDRGQMRMFGDTEEVCEAYMQDFRREELENQRTQSPPSEI